MSRLPVVLLLYWRPAGVPVRQSTREHVGALRSLESTGVEVVAFNAVGGAPAWLARLRPAAVLLHTTFLAIRWIEPFDQWRRRSAWLGDLPGPKLAFPQDEYDHSEVLDEWLGEIGVSDVFTPLPEHVEVLYRSRAGGAAFHPALTGYLDLSRNVGPTQEQRPVDVVYRAGRLPFWFGFQGQLKTRVGEDAARAAARLGLRADISVDPERTVHGPLWLQFLASGRSVVGCESGSSALDRRGELRVMVEAVLSERPQASFGEVSAALPGGWDSYNFVAASPRHFEAAATRTAQVLVEGRYSGLLLPERHYVPVRRDLSDLDEALERVRDPIFVATLVERAYEELVASGLSSQARLREAVTSVLRDRGLEVTEGGDSRRRPRARLVEGVSHVASLRRPGGLVRVRTGARRGARAPGSANAAPPTSPAGRFPRGSSRAAA